MAKEVNSDRFTQLLVRVQEEIPGAKVLRRSDSTLMSLVQWLLTRVLRIDPTINQYTTTIGRTVYVPEDFWDQHPDSRYRLLRHELVHLRQFRCWPVAFLSSCFLWRINSFIMSFCYLFLFPIKMTMRAKFEREGYTQTILTHHEEGWPDYLLDRSALKEHIVDVFSGPPYFYMWRKEAAAEWYDETLAKIEKGEIVNTKDRIY